MQANRLYLAKVAQKSLAHLAVQKMAVVASYRQALSA